MTSRSSRPALRLRVRRGRLVCLLRPRRSGDLDRTPRLVALIAEGRPPFLRRLALYRADWRADGAPRAA